MREIQKEIQLFDGDGLKILPTSKNFLFKCCDCGLIHNIKIIREGKNIILRFTTIELSGEKYNG